MKIPGLAGTIVAATGVVVTTLPPCSDRTYALMLVVSSTSHGIWAMIWVGDTKKSGDANSVEINGRAANSWAA